MSDLSNYLHALSYHEDLCEDVDNMCFDDQINLFSVLKHFDFSDIEIRFMIEFPNAIDTVRDMCENKGGITYKFMNDWRVNYG